MQRRTTPVLFIDANIPIYTTGRPHRLKDPCTRVLALVAVNRAAFLTSSEVLQEVLHHCVSSGRWAESRGLFASFAALMTGRVEPVTGSDVEQAAALADRYPGLEARDLVHAGVMLRLGIRHVVSADRRLSVIQELERLDPQQVDGWSAALL